MPCVFGQLERPLDVLSDSHHLAPSPPALCSCQCNPLWTMFMVRVRVVREYSKPVGLGVSGRPTTQTKEPLQGAGG